MSLDLSLAYDIRQLPSPYHASDSDLIMFYVTQIRVTSLIRDYYQFV